MAIGTGIAIYFLIWWMMIFISLPFRMRTQLEAGNVVDGSEAAAPENPQLLKRMIWNSILSLGVFFLYWLVFYYFDVTLDELPHIVPNFD